MPGGKTSTPVYLGQAGSITMTSLWEGRSLVSEGRREFASGNSTEVKEVLSLSAESRTLEIAITITGADGKSESKLIYTETRDLGPCQSWPSPCKYPSR